MKVELKAFIYGNLGDDLFVKIICDKYKNCTFYLSVERQIKIRSKCKLFSGDLKRVTAF